MPIPLIPYSVQLQMQAELQCRSPILASIMANVENLLLPGYTLNTARGMVLKRPEISGQGDYLNTETLVNWEKRA